MSANCIRTSERANRAGFPLETTDGSSKESWAAEQNFLKTLLTEAQTAKASIKGPLRFLSRSGKPPGFGLGPQKLLPRLRMKSKNSKKTFHELKSSFESSQSLTGIRGLLVPLAQPPNQKQIYKFYGERYPRSLINQYYFSYTMSSTQWNITRSTMARLRKLDGKLKAQLTILTGDLDSVSFQM